MTRTRQDVTLVFSSILADTAEALLKLERLKRFGLSDQERIDLLERCIAIQENISEVSNAYYATLTIEVPRS